MAFGRFEADFASALTYYGDNLETLLKNDELAYYDTLLTIHPVAESDVNLTDAKVAIRLSLGKKPDNGTIESEGNVDMSVAESKLETPTVTAQQESLLISSANVFSTPNTTQHVKLSTESREKKISNAVKADPRPIFGDPVNQDHSGSPDRSNYAASPRRYLQHVEEQPSQQRSPPKNALIQPIDQQIVQPMVQSSPKANEPSLAQSKPKLTAPATEEYLRQTIKEVEEWKRKEKQKFTTMVDIHLGLLWFTLNISFYIPAEES